MHDFTIKKEKSPSSPLTVTATTTTTSSSSSSFDTPLPQQKQQTAVNKKIKNRKKSLQNPSPSSSSLLRTSQITGEKILDEDQWSHTVQQIIQRDFFPDLPRLRLEVELMRAEQSNDIIGTQVAREKLDALLLQKRRERERKRRERKRRKQRLQNASQAREEGKEEENSKIPAAEKSQWETDDNDDGTCAHEKDEAQGDDDEEQESEYTRYLMKLLKDHEAMDRSRSGVGSCSTGVDTNDLSLDEFMARYTSEDNASFAQLAEKMHQQHMAKVKYFYGLDKNSTLNAPDASRVKHDPLALTSPPPVLALDSQRETKAIASSEALKSITSSECEVDRNETNDAELAKQSIISDRYAVAVPQKSTRTEPIPKKPENETAQPWTQEHMVLNALMFSPSAQSRRDEEENSRALMAPPKQVLIRNTRFSSLTDIDDDAADQRSDITSDTLSTTSSQLMAIEQRKQSDRAYGLDLVSEGLLERATSSSDLKPGKGRSTNPFEASPQIMGYGFLHTPTPAPGQHGQTPIMTWGTLDATPMRLDDTPTPVFKVPPTPKRELLSHKLAEKANRSMRARSMKSASANYSTNTPSTSGSLTPRDGAHGSRTPSLSARLSDMSPAAQRLAGKVLKQRQNSSLGLSRSQQLSSMSASHVSSSPLRSPFGGSLTPQISLLSKRTAQTPTNSGNSNDDIRTIKRKKQR